MDPCLCDVPGAQLVLYQAYGATLELTGNGATVSVSNDGEVGVLLIPVLRGPRGPAGPTGPTSGNVDGGTASSVYTPNQHIDGGNAGSF